MSVEVPLSLISSDVLIKKLPGSFPQLQVLLFCQGRGGHGFLSVCVESPRRQGSPSYPQEVGGEVSGPELEPGTLLKGDLGPWL